jgi:peptidoglycan hydrolase FlgJ
MEGFMSLSPSTKAVGSMDIDQAVRTLQQKNSSYLEGLNDLKENAEGLKKACSEFESVFIGMLLKEFRKSIPKDGLIPKSFTMETYEEMLDNQMASDVSKSGGTGIGDILFSQLSRNIKAYQSDSGGQKTGTILERKG